MKKAHIYVNYDNMVVLDLYLNIISDALKKRGYICDNINDLSTVDKDDLIIFSMGKDAYMYYLKGYRNFMIWQQGIAAEESYMRNKSRLRMAVLNYMDCFAIKKAKMIFFVSDYMKKHYEKLVGRSFDDKVYIMPCYNESLDTSVFDRKDYSKKNFTYVGSITVWQCFEETVRIFSKIEEAVPEAFFKVLTFNTKEAEEIILKYKIKNYEIKCVPKAEVAGELQEITYGFILRDDVEVNRVATPTKISSYLSAGVIPIYSSCLTDFSKVVQNKAFAIAFDLNQDPAELIEIIRNNIDVQTVKDGIEEVFGSYYCTPKHIERIVRKMEELKI